MSLGEMPLLRIAVERQVELWSRDHAGEFPDMFGRQNFKRAWTEIIEPAAREMAATLVGDRYTDQLLRALRDEAVGQLSDLQDERAART